MNFRSQSNHMMVGLGRRSSSIVNVRDRTVGLSNVFAGRDLSSNQVHRSLRASQHQASAAALAMINRNKFSSSSAMNFNKQGEGAAENEERKEVNTEAVYREK